MDGENLFEAARRLAWIQDVNGSQRLPLTIVIEVPKEIGVDECRADATVSCTLFEKKVYAVGIDSLQALTGAIRVVYGLLLGFQRYGYVIFWFEPGDLEHAPLWGSST